MKSLSILVFVVGLILVIGLAACSDPGCGNGTESEKAAEAYRKCIETGSVNRANMPEDCGRRAYNQYCKKD